MALATPAAAGPLPVQGGVHVNGHIINVIIGSCGFDSGDASEPGFGFHHNTPARVWVSHPDPSSGSGWTEASYTICVQTP